MPFWRACSPGASRFFCFCRARTTISAPPAPAPSTPAAPRAEQPPACPAPEPAGGHEPRPPPRVAQRALVEVRPLVDGGVGDRGEPPLEALAEPLRGLDRNECPA